MNSDLSSDDEYRQDVFTTAMPLINSKSDVMRLILKIRQHDRKEIRKKPKIMMTDKVIVTAEKRRKKVSLSYIIREK